jgi:hypothetical protein
MPVARIFASPEDAQTAADHLHEAGFEHVFVIESGTDAAGIAKHNVVPSAAVKLAAKIAGGATLVLVRPAFGAGYAALEILDSVGPARAESAMELEDSMIRSSSATPLSDAFGWKVLSKDPAPLSSWFGLPTLSTSQKMGDSSMGLPTLSKNATPLSSALGLGTLSGKAAPLSGMLGLPLLSKAAAPLSSMFGMGTLSGQPPKAKLIDDPAPLSRKFGLPVLKGDDTSMS